MTFFLIVSILHLIPLNALISYRALRDPLLTASQRRWKVAIVWLVPFLGALLVWFQRRQAHAALVSEAAQRQDPPMEPEKDIPHDHP